MGNLVDQTLYPPPLFGRFHQVRDVTHNYPIASTIMDQVGGDNWKQESFTDLYDEDALWAFAMTSSKRMGLHMAQKVDVRNTWFNTTNSKLQGPYPKVPHASH